MVALDSVRWRASSKGALNHTTPHQGEGECRDDNITIGRWISVQLKERERERDWVGDVVREVGRTWESSRLE